MKKQTLILILALAISIGSYGQKTVPKVTIGKPAPDMQLQISNGTTKTKSNTSISAYRGKWLVMDFWSKTCSICIASFPKLNQMQTQFQGQLNILLVGINETTYNAGIEKMYRNIERESGLQLDNTFGTEIFKTFEVRAYPHVIIIDPSGIVQVITFSSELTPENLEQLIRGGANNFVQNVARPKAEKTSDAISWTTSDSSGTLSHQSRFSQWRSTDGLHLRFDLKGYPKRGSYGVSGVRLDRIYMIAMLGCAQWEDSHPLYATTWRKTVLEVADTLKFASNLARQTGLYNYTIRFADTAATTSQLMSAMRSDLEKSFPYSARIEKRLMPVYMLVTAPGTATSTLKSSHERKKAVGDYGGMQLQHYKMSEVIRKLAVSHPNKIFIDGTGIDFAIDLDLSANLIDFTSLSAAIRRNGLELRLSEKLVDVLVISDRK